MNIARQPVALLQDGPLLRLLRHAESLAYVRDAARNQQALSGLNRVQANFHGKLTAVFPPSGKLAALPHGSRHWLG